MRIFAKISTTIVTFILSVQLGVAQNPPGFNASSNELGVSYLQAILACLLIPQQKIEQEIPWEKKWDAILTHVLNLNKKYYCDGLLSAYLVDQKLKKNPDIEIKLEKFSNHFKHSDDIKDYFFDYFKGQPKNKYELQMLNAVLDWRFLQDVKRLKMNEFVYTILQKQDLDVVAEFSQSIVERWKDLRDHEFFSQANSIARLLKEITQMSRTEKQLSTLKKKVLKFYTKWDEGELSIASKQELERLGIQWDEEELSTAANQAETQSNFNIPSFNIPRSTAAWALPFLSLACNITSAEARGCCFPPPQRPGWFAKTCTDTLEGCLSEFVPLTTYGGLTPEISTMQNDIRVQVVPTDMALAGNNTNVITALEGDMLNLFNQTTPSYYSDLTTYQVQAIPGANITSSFYPPDGTQPLTTDVYTLTGSNQYNLTTYNYLYSNSSTVTGTGNLNPYYIAQLPNGGMWILTVLSKNQTFGIGTLVIRPDSGTPRIVWQRLITPNTTNLSVNPANLPTTPIYTAKPPQASAQDNSTYDQFLASLLVTGQVATNCQGSQSVPQFVNANNLTNTPLYQALMACFQQPSLDPLLCADAISLNPGYTRLSFYFSELSNLYSNVYKRIVDGPNVRDCTYRTAPTNASSVVEECVAYQWNPSVGVSTLTTTILPQTFNMIQGSLVNGQIQKFAELYYSQVANATNTAIVLNANWTASGTSFKYFAYLDPANTCPSQKRGVGLQTTIGEGQQKDEIAQRHYTFDFASLKAKEAQKGWYDRLKGLISGNKPSFEALDPYKMSPEQWYQFCRTFTFKGGKPIQGVTLPCKGKEEHTLRFIEEGDSTFQIHHTWRSRTIDESFAQVMVW
jgi:hypothetical protein